ncbi:MAG: hypothetical protein ABF586_13300 [Sporolactobacillus sp.]
MNVYTRFFLMFIIWAGLMVMLNTWLSYDDKHKEVIADMTESANVASVLAANSRSRIDSGQMIVDEGTFKQDFEQLFQRNMEIHLTNVQYTFDFRNDSQTGAVKAVKIKIHDGKGNDYHTTYVPNITTSD